MSEGSSNAKLPTTESEPTALVHSSTDNRYNFDRATVVVQALILPTSSQKEERLVLLNAGIQGEEPVTATCQLSNLLESKALAEILIQFEQALLRLALATAERQRPKQARTRPASESSTAQTGNDSSIDQLSLFG